MTDRPTSSSFALLRGQALDGSSALTRLPIQSAPSRSWDGVRDRTCFEGDLSQLSDGRGDGPAEKQASLRGRPAADERRAGPAQDDPGLRQQRAEVRAKSGREDRGVKRLNPGLPERDAVRSEIRNVAADFDPASANLGQRPDVDDRDPTVLCDRL